MSNLTVLQWAFVERVGLDQGVTSGAIRKWRERDVVPWRWRPVIAAKAALVSLALPNDFMGVS
jgi:hypothetical protein